MILAIFFALASAQTLPTAKADECRFVRLDSPGRSMEFVPVRNQGTLGVCYAETAAQMIDAWRFSHGERDHKLLTSSVAAAIGFKEDTHREGMDGGAACPTIRAIVKNGSCDQLKSVEAAIAKRGLHAFTAQLAGYFDRYRTYARQTEVAADEVRRRMPAQLNAPDALERKREAALESTTREVQVFLKDSGFSPQMIAPAKYMKFLLDQPNQNVFFQGVMERSCFEKSHYLESTPPVCAPLRARGKAELAARIRQRLLMPNAQPVSLAYCAGVLKRGRGFRGLASGHGKCIKKGDHVSLIIGMRPGSSANSCQFLVRNSWGEKCKGYSTDWECERGNIWVDSHDLLENTKGVAALEQE